MAALTEQTILIYRGEAVTIPFTFVPTEDISGQTLVFTVTKGLNKTTKILGPLPVVIDDGATGEAHVTLLEEQTNLKPSSDYRWDAWCVDEGVEQVKGLGPFVVLGNSRVPPIE